MEVSVVLINCITLYAHMCVCEAEEEKAAEAAELAIRKARCGAIIIRFFGFLYQTFGGKSSLLRAQLAAAALARRTRGVNINNQVMKNEKIVFFRQTNTACKQISLVEHFP
jgi:hypothetical protein